MKLFPSTMIIACAVFLAACPRAADGEAVKKDLAQLQGEWSMTAGSVGGADIPSEILQNSRRVCRGDETTVTVGGQLFLRAKFALDVSTKPRSIDYQVTAGPNAGKKQLGIYELNGTTVKFCFAAPGRERPADFSTKAGDGRTSSVWKREKE